LPGRVFDSILGWATCRNLLVVWGVFVAFNLVVMGPAYRRIEAFSGGPGAIDFLVVYRPEKAYDMITAYGDRGRRYYATIALTLDTVFPMLTGLTFSLTLAGVFSHAFSDEGVLHRALLVPMGAMVADILENVGIVTMLMSYPRNLMVIALLASSFSTVKWTAIAAQSLLIVIGLIGWLINTVRGGPPGRSDKGRPVEE